VKAVTPLIANDISCERLLNQCGQIESVLASISGRLASNRIELLLIDSYEYTNARNWKRCTLSRDRLSLEVELSAFTKTIMRTDVQ